MIERNQQRAKSRVSPAGVGNSAGAPESIGTSSARNSSESQTAARFQGRLRDLSELLMGFVRLHEELIEIVQRKLLAMRKSDLDAIQECVVRDGELTRTISDREGLRKRLMVLIGCDLGIGEEDSATMPLSRLATHVDEKSSLKFRVAGDRLSAILKEIAKVNLVITLFGRRMLEHYSDVFAQITQGLNESPVYARTARQMGMVEAQVFEATA